MTTKRATNQTWTTTHLVAHIGATETKTETETETIDVLHPHQRQCLLHQYAVLPFSLIPKRHRASENAAVLEQILMCDYRLQTMTIMTIREVGVV
jgi:hypothetical protein